VRAHNEAVNRLDFMPHREPIEADRAGRRRRERDAARWRALAPAQAACRLRRARQGRPLAYLEAHRAKGEVVTGLLYVEDDPLDLHDAQNTVAAPLNALSDAELVPGSAALAAFNAKLA
jgi:2-oxoglutarate ferredoxin oxidoreductase subunit beta